MELKSYQKKVIADLTRYLELLNETKNYEAAFRFFWQEKSAPTLGYYQDILPGVPNLCFKVPQAVGRPLSPVMPFAPFLTLCLLPRQRQWYGSFPRTQSWRRR